LTACQISLSKTPLLNVSSNTLSHSIRKSAFSIGPTLGAGLLGRRLYTHPLCSPREARPIQRSEPTIPWPSKLDHGLAAHPPHRYLKSLTMDTNDLTEKAYKILNLSDDINHIITVHIGSMCGRLCGAIGINLVQKSV
jgi:hypothetical protein